MGKKEWEGEKEQKKMRTKNEFVCLLFIRYLSDSQIPFVSFIRLLNIDFYRIGVIAQSETRFNIIFFLFIFLSMLLLLLVFFHFSAQFVVFNVLVGMLIWFCFFFYSSLDRVTWFNRLARFVLCHLIIHFSCRSHSFIRFRFVRYQTTVYLLSYLTFSWTLFSRSHSTFNFFFTFSVQRSRYFHHLILKKHTQLESTNKVNITIPQWKCHNTQWTWKMRWIPSEYSRGKEKKKKKKKITAAAAAYTRNAVWKTEKQEKMENP